MQQPTLTNIHIRSPEDAHKVFYAVQLGLLPEITRRLDAQERKQLASGNVYCWADKPAGETHTFEAGGSGQSTRAGLGMQAGQPPAYEFTIERWTEGLSWSASRIRE
ncbi:hypothetical protein PHLCEN_2v13146 [Hermanssonia centrifuga]|uniref:Uncharacterized protein n=1 Tax=Hermanssonia centrifuga TaxID=98765 RepID=A0A2R6NF12_9APHY|nr:hypothetical protein PHLCEN_2v13146 [Hermanssonia centrifuga]